MAKLIGAICMSAVLVFVLQAADAQDATPKTPVPGGGAVLRGSAFPKASSLVPSDAQTFLKKYDPENGKAVTKEMFLQISRQEVEAYWARITEGVDGGQIDEAKVKEILEAAAQTMKGKGGYTKGGGATKKGAVPTDPAGP